MEVVALVAVVLAVALAAWRGKLDAPESVTLIVGAVATIHNTVRRQRHE